MHYLHTSSLNQANEKNHNQQKMMTMILTNTVEMIVNVYQNKNQTALAEMINICEIAFNKYYKIIIIIK